MYLGDHYGALRNPMYRDYEKHPYGAWEASSANANANKTCYQTKSYQGNFAWIKREYNLVCHVAINLPLNGSGV